MTTPAEPDLRDLLHMSLITQLRIYDVLIAILANASEESAVKVLDKHKRWEYVGPLPFSPPEK